MDISSIGNIHSSLPDYNEVRRRLSPATEIRNGVTTEEKQAIREAAKAFESYFLQIMLREMRRTIPEDGGLIPKSQAERIFTEMLDEEMAKDMAQAGGIGLAQVIIEQMTRSYASNMR